LAANREGDFRKWHVPGLTPEVIYSTALLQRLAREAEEAFGGGDPGEESGGVLFGTCEDGQVLITAARALDSGHERGPGFDLSPDDERRLQQLVEDAAADPSLRDLAPVGWYRSRADSPIALSEEDVRLYDRYFPLPWQVALVLRPVPGEPARGGFFFRPARGALRTDGTYLEFTTDNAAAEATDFSGFGMFGQPPRDMLDAPVRRMPRSRVLILGILGGLAAVVAAVGGFLWGRSNATAASMPALSLRLVKSNGELRALWNGTGEPMTRSTKGTLEVRDGVTSADFPLNATLLRGGSWPIANQSSEVSVRLTVEMEGLGNVVEVARYIGPPAAPPPPVASPAQTAETAALRKEIQALEADLADQTQANDTSEQRADALQQQLNARQLNARLGQPKPEPAVRLQTSPPPSPPAPVTTAAPTVRQPVTQSAGSQPTASGTPAPANPQAPPQSAAAAPPPAPSFSENTTPPATRPPPVIPPPPPEPARPTYSGPASGKTIWTGYLAAGASLTIEGRRASAGSVNGNLPSAPLRVTVFPAEFSSGGLSVYSGQSRHAGNNVVEPRSAQNGWLETRYLFNAERARGVTVAEPPSSANGFKLTLRGGDKPVSVVVIEWQVAQ
jgi:hypothetical protein